MAAISYATLSSNFARVKDLPPSQVGSVIGGKVEASTINYFLNYFIKPLYKIILISIFAKELKRIFIVESYKIHIICFDFTLHRLQLGVKE